MWPPDFGRLGGTAGRSIQFKEEGMKRFIVWHSKGIQFLVAVFALTLCLQGTISTASAEEGASLVRKIQEALKAQGFDPGPLDGFWGSKTESALKEFQESKGLEGSGKFTPKTKRNLFSSAEGSASPAAHPGKSAPAPTAGSSASGQDIADSEIVWGRHK